MPDFEIRTIYAKGLAGCRCLHCPNAKSRPDPKRPIMGVDRPYVGHPKPTRLTQLGHRTAAARIPRRSAMYHSLLLS